MGPGFIVRGQHKRALFTVQHGPHAVLRLFHQPFYTEHRGQAQALGYNGSMACGAALLGSQPLHDRRVHLGNLRRQQLFGGHNARLRQAGQVFLRHTLQVAQYSPAHIIQIARTLANYRLSGTGHGFGIGAVHPVHRFTGRGSLLCDGIQNLFLHHHIVQNLQMRLKNSALCAAARL